MGRPRIHIDDATIQALRAAKGNHKDIAKAFGLGQEMVRRVRARLGRFREGYVDKPIGTRPSPGVAQHCTTCAQISSATEPAAWSEPFGHRCPHGQPCRANGKACGSVCSLCEVQP